MAAGGQVLSRGLPLEGASSTADAIRDCLATADYQANLPYRDRAFAGFHSYIASGPNGLIGRPLSHGMERQRSPAKVGTRGFLEPVLVFRHYLHAVVAGIPALVPISWGFFRLHEICPTRQANSPVILFLSTPAAMPWSGFAVRT
jgi:hypothetical protein